MNTDRENQLSALGIELGSIQPNSAEGSLGAADFTFISGYAEYTPIKVLAGDVVTPNADVERDQPRD
jgi:hypothetical protein